MPSGRHGSDCRTDAWRIAMDRTGGLRSAMSIQTGRFVQYPVLRERRQCVLRSFVPPIRRIRRSSGAGHVYHDSHKPEDRELVLEEYLIEQGVAFVHEPPLIYRRLSTRLLSQNSRNSFSNRSIPSSSRSRRRRHHRSSRIPIRMTTVETLTTNHPGDVADTLTRGGHQAISVGVSRAFHFRYQC